MNSLNFKEKINKIRCMADRIKYSRENKRKNRIIENHCNKCYETVRKNFPELFQNKICIMRGIEKNQK